MGVLDDSSSSSSSSESENEEPSQETITEEPKMEVKAEEVPESPVVVDDDQEQRDNQEEKQESDPKEESSSSSSSDSSSSSSSESEEEDEKEDKSEQSSSSSSESSSDNSEDEDDKNKSIKEEVDMASSLAKALAEREKEPELGARRPSSPGDNAPDTPDYMETPEVQSFNFNADPSIRARSAHDFGDVPPALPPKARDFPPPMIQDEPPVPSNIIHVDDNTATLGRGRWSDDEESIPGPHSPVSPEQDRRRRRRSSSRHRDRSRSRKRSNSRPKHTVIDVGRPYNPDAINPKAMVSLYSPHDDQHNYDSTANTGDELNKLIREANNMDYNQYNPPDGAQRAEILYPSLRKDRPIEQNLNSKFLDAFTRIAPESSRSKPENTSYSGFPRPSENSHRRSSSTRSKKKKSKSMEVDGDDEISLENEDFQIIAEPPQRNISEIYPSDYTDFETASELEEHKSSEDYSSSSSSESEDGAADAYDTVADGESELEQNRKQLNPIVNEKYKICTDIDTFKSKSFPRRVKQGKPKKERPKVNTGAISLSQFPRRPQGASLPYYHQDDFENVSQIRRTGSADDMLAGYQPGTYHPHITVVRDQPHSFGYDPVVTEDNMVRASMSMPAKKFKPKKKKEKEIRVQVNQVDASGNPVVNSNNLHVNLLPSSDPNIINLNIRSNSTTQSKVETITPVAAPVENHPITIVQSEPQHRVVEVSNQPDPINIAQPVNPSAGDANISSTTGVVLAGSLQPDFGPGMIPATQFPGQPFVPANHLYPVIDQNMQMTQSTFTANRVIESNADLPPNRSLPNESGPEIPLKVVEIDNPWPAARHGSLPGHSGEPSQLQGGDSGIDLSLNGRKSNRQSQRTVDLEMKRSKSKSRKESEESSSSESSTDRGRRSKMSQRRLKSREYVDDSNVPSLEYIQWYKSQYLRPSCMFIVIKHFFFVLNLLFTILGLALIGLGIYGLINMYMNDVLHINYVVTDPLFTVLILGVVITLIAFHGAAGFVRNNLCMLRFFGVLLITLLFATIAGCITFWVLRAEATVFASKTFGNLAKNYTEDRKGLAYTLDTIQTTFDCCGFDDKNGYLQWKRNSLFKCEDDACDLPSSCCKSSSNPNFQCSTSSPTNMLRSGSCISALSDSIRQYTAIIIAVWIGIWVLIILQFIAIFLMRKEIAYLKIIKKAVNFPENNQPFSESYSSAEESKESSSESSSSSEEERRYKRRKTKNKNRRNKKTKNGNHRTGSYHVNDAFSMDDERSYRKQKQPKKRRRRH